MNWDKATDIMVAAAVATAIIFFMMGVTQWIKRKSFKKIDKTLLALIAPYALMALTYVVFDYIFVLNTRPDGSGEASFPSTHTMITATVFFCAAIALPKYIKQKSLVAFLDLVMLAFVILVPVGRVLANKHWVSDCIGGLIFAAIFAA
ncbi:MAG: phosphatase PAP2 family protein, partial [Candidatus Saccharibacteria bacterium]|nr:phosphatase PAP2 family protein [Candidatus Saccharibacteria bacterium]